MGNRGEQVEKSGLHEDTEILDIEERLSHRLAGFIKGLETCKSLHPNVIIRYRKEESSFVIALDEDGADKAMGEGDFDLALELLQEAAEHRLDPHIDVLVVCEADQRRDVRGAFETIDIFAKMCGGVIVEDQKIESNEIGGSFQILDKTIEIPHDGRPNYFKRRTYRFSESG